MNTLAIITEFFGIFAVPFNAVFIAGMLVVAFISVRGLKASYSKTAGIIIVLGILGTFTGIILGLLNFDVNNIDASIPPLLEGLKTAFATSIAGMVISTILKGIEIVKNKKEEQSEEDDLALSINKYLEELVKINRENQIQFKSGISQIVKSLTGDGESTLMTQMQKLRTGIGDRLDGLANISEEQHNKLDIINKSLGVESGMPISSVLYNMDNNIRENLKVIAEGQTVLKDEFIKYSEKVQEYNYKALVNALESVIKDFNTKINEQFGENFKQLNEGVGKMLNWQSNYKDYIDRVEEQINMAIKGIVESKTSIQKIREEANQFSDIAVKFDTNLSKLNESRITVENGLQSFSDISAQAKEFLPALEKSVMKINSEIENKYNSYSNMLKEYTNEYMKSSENVISDLRISFNTITNELNKHEKAIKEEQLDFIRNIQQQHNAFRNDYSSKLDMYTSLIKEYTDNYSNQSGTLINSTKETFSIMNSGISEQQNKIKEVQTGFNKNIEKMIQTTEQTLEDQVKRTNKVFAEQYQKLDQQLEETLKQSIGSLGSNLASLSNKFVQDYTPLTNELQRLVRISREVA